MPKQPGVGYIKSLNYVLITNPAMGSKIVWLTHNLNFTSAVPVDTNTNSNSPLDSSLDLFGACH